MTIKLTEAAYNHMRGDSGGYCLACGAEAYGVEPDAENYICDECEEAQVFGIEILLVMDKIEIT